MTAQRVECSSCGLTWMGFQMAHDAVWPMGVECAGMTLQVGSAAYHMALEIAARYPYVEVVRDGVEPSWWRLTANVGGGQRYVESDGL